MGGLRCEEWNGYASPCTINSESAVRQLYEITSGWMLQECAILVGYVLLIAGTRYGLAHFIWDPFATRIMRREDEASLKLKKKTDQKKKSGKANSEAREVVASKKNKSMLIRRQKIKESGWYALYYPFSFWLCFSCYRGEPWSMFPTTNFWLDWPLQPMSDHFMHVYLFECAFYIQALIQLVFFELRRRDFWEFVVHHAATILLIGMSFWARYHRVGLVILFLHDFADIFLYVAKVLHYFGLEAGTNTVFVLFAIAFFCSRLVIFPLIIIRSTTFEHVWAMPFHVHTNVFLYVLLGLHVFWFVLIVRMIFRAFKAKTVEGDIRSDDED